MSNDRLRFAAEFPKVSLKQWEASAQKSLHGRELDSLTAVDFDGITSRILYSSATESSGREQATRPGAVQGLVRRQRVFDSDDIDKALAADVEAIVAAPLLAAGLDLASSPPVFLPTGVCSSDEILAHLGRVAECAGTTDGGLGMDPLGAHAELPYVELDEVSGLVARTIRVAPGLLSLSVSSAATHLGGASDAEELGALLGSCVGYLRCLDQSGLAPSVAARQMEWSLQLGPDFFRSVVKLRAARRLLDRLISSCGGQGTFVKIHASTSMRYTTLYGQSVNLLRATSSAAAALVGGASSLTVLPYDVRSVSQDATAARMARNIPKVLFEEAHLARVADPAGGSWYVEHHTDLLARKAWEFFQSIEARGGMPAVLADGWLGETIAETAETCRQMVAERTIPITGVTEFALLDEWSVEPALFGQTGFAPRLLDEDFAQLRLAAADYAEDCGDPLSVSLVCVGSQAEHSERLSWVTDLLAAGGVVAQPTSLDSVRDGGVVFLCGSDEGYAREGVSLVSSVLELGAPQVQVVGGSRWLDELSVSGVIEPGVDVVEFLRQLQLDLGVTR